MTKKVLIQILFLSFSYALFGQDYHFSQYNAMPFWLNPAQVSETNDIDAAIIYRTQYKGVDNPYNTYGAFASASLLKKRDNNSFFGVGVGFIQDNNKNIQYKSSLAALAISYHLRINRKSIISAGLQPFFFQKTLNYASLKWGNQFDGSSYNSSLPTGESGNFSQLSKIDGSFGFTYQYTNGTHSSVIESSKKFQVGFAMFHIPGVRYSYYGSQEKVYSRFCLNMSYTFKPENSKISINPVLLLQKQGPSNDIIFGLNMFYMLQESSSKTGFVKGSSINAGILYRVKDAIIINAGVNYQNYAFGVAYDINASSLTNSTKSFGAFEVFLRYKMNRGYWRNSN